MCDFLSKVEPLSGSLATLVRLPECLRATGRSLFLKLVQVSNSDEVIGGGSELKDPTDQPHSTVSGFAQQPHRFQPAEDFFHSFALSLTNFITRMARGALVDRAAPSLVVLSHVRCHLAGAQIGDKVSGVVSFVTTYGDPYLLRSLCQHCQRRFSFGSAAGTSQQRIHHQAIAILPSTRGPDKPVLPRCPWSS